jgi:hypothetical protein
MTATTTAKLLSPPRFSPSYVPVRCSRSHSSISRVASGSPARWSSRQGFSTAPKCSTLLRPGGAVPHIERIRAWRENGCTADQLIAQLGVNIIGEVEVARFLRRASSV